MYLIIGEELTLRYKNDDTPWGINKDNYGYGVNRWNFKIQKKEQNTNSI